MRTRDDTVSFGEWFVKRRRRRETFQVIFGLVGLVEFRLNGRDVNGGLLVTQASVRKLQRRSLPGGVVLSCCSCFPKPRHGASTDHRSRPVLRRILRDLVTWVTTVRQALNCGQRGGLASSTSTINNIVKFPLGSWGTGLMCWDSLSDAGRPSAGGASRFGMRRGLLGGQLLARLRAGLSTRCCSKRPGRSRLRSPTSRNPYGKN